ncbi:MAG: aminotransferase class I/II-fold pyridoxal phosphate-dependent enzyme [candidate division WOR-3 bacterium]
MKFPERIRGVPPYIYAEMDEAIKRAKEKGLDIINIAHGDPDLEPPHEVVEELKKSLSEKDFYKYPSYWGLIDLRKKISEWMKKRFKVFMDPEEEIMILIGGKEGITHLFLALCEKGDYALIPDPAYPTYRTSVLFSGSIPYELPLLKENDFLPDLNSIKKSILNKTKIIILNYPNNPTSKRADIKFFRELFDFCNKWGIYIIHDNAYSEIYEDEAPPSIFEVDGAKEIAVEIHSFSKTYNMQGFRIGWACGSKEILKALSIIKTNTDSGVFIPIQKAAIKAIELYDSFTPQLRKIYKERRKIIKEYLEKIGWRYYNSDSTIYVWAEMNSKEKDSMKIVSDLIDKKGVMIGPGSGYGKYGESYLRFSLTQTENRIKEGMEKFIEYLEENI